MRKSNKLVMAYECDYCGDITPHFVTTSKYQHFCREQIVGYPATKDCLEDYFQSKKKTLNPSL